MKQSCFFIFKYLSDDGDLATVVGGFTWTSHIINFVVVYNLMSFPRNAK